MPKSEREASLLEAKLLGALHHPNIVTCYESFTERGRLCIVMDYCAGGDMYMRLKRQKGVPLAEDRILDWFTQMCLGLKHVHDRKVLHRDLKTQNVFMTADGRCKLGDFGVSKVLSGTTQLAQTAVGTPYYLSPEICENKSYDNKSDVWSLGCVLYEMCSLQHPFEGASLKLLIVKILRGNYTPVSSRYSRAVRDVIAQMLQRDPARRPSVNEILSKQPFKDRAKRWLDEDVHADEFSHTVIHRKPGAPASRRTPASDHNSKIAGGGVRLSPPRARPAPYPSGGEGVPTAQKAPGKPSDPPKPPPSRGGLIGRERPPTAVAARDPPARGAKDPKVAFTPPVHRVGARGGGVPIWAAHAANRARPYDPVPLPSRAQPRNEQHPNFPSRAQSAAADAAKARREAEEINRRRREQALDERRRKLREEEEARMARRKRADEARAREREDAEKRRAAEREEARREFLRRQAEARANKQRAQMDLGNQPVEVLVPKRTSPAAPPRHSAPACVDTLPRTQATKKRPSPPPSAAPSRPAPTNDPSNHRKPGTATSDSPTHAPSISPPPSASSSPPRKKLSPDRPEWHAVTTDQTGPSGADRPDSRQNPVGGRVAGFVKVGQAPTRQDGFVKVGVTTREPSAADARRRVWEENKAAAERNRARAEGKATSAPDTIDLPPPRESRSSSPQTQERASDPRREVWLENKAAAERNRERAVADARGDHRGSPPGVEVHADVHGARVFVDAPTGCVLGATTCEPEELAARLGTIISDGADDDDDPMTIRAGSALCSGEDDGRGDVAMTEAETDGVVPECDGATASDATSAEKSKSGRNAKSSKSNTDGGKHSVANTDSTVSLDHDSTFINPAKFYLDGATVRLNDVDDTSCLSDRVEALRVHLERNLGQEKFVAAYRALDNLNESDDEDKVVGSLCDVMGEDISYLGLIHQLLVCEDSMHAANEGVEV